MCVCTCVCEGCWWWWGCNRSSQLACVVSCHTVVCMYVCVWEDEYSRLYHSRSGDCLSDPLRSD